MILTLATTRRQFETSVEIAETLLPRRPYRADWGGRSESGFNPSSNITSGTAPFQSSKSAPETELSRAPFWNPLGGGGGGKFAITSLMFRNRFAKNNERPCAVFP